MLIKYIEFKDFLTFKGTQKIDFSIKDHNNQNITVIIAPNNSGKTSVIRALEFLFYGKVKDIENKKLINITALKSLKKEEKLISYIKAKLILNKDKSIEIERVFHIYRKGPDLLDIVIDIVKNKIIPNSPSELPITEDAIIESKLKELIPESMFNFFFFRGEELADRLFTSNDQLIDKGLKDMLYQAKWDDVISTLNNVKAAIIKDISKIKRNNKLFQDLINSKNSKNITIERLQNHNDDLKEKIINIEKELEKINQEILRLIGLSNPNAKEMLITKKQLKNKYLLDLKIIENERLKFLGKNGFISFLKNKVEFISVILNDLDNKNLLPPDISEARLRTILLTQKCICGQICKDGSEYKKSIEKLLADCFAKTVSRKLLELSKFLRKDVQDSFYSKYENIIIKLNEFRININKIDKNLAEVESIIQILEKQYDDSVEEVILTLNNNKRRFENDLSKFKNDIRENGTRLNLLLKEIKDIENQIKIISKDDEQCDLFNTEDKLCDILKEYAIKAKSNMNYLFYKYLQESVSIIYDEIVTDGSKAVINSKNLLPSVERNGVKGFGLGGGQKQTLLLAYLISLSNLRKSVNEELYNELRVKLTNEQCFFMDSVFAPMEGEYRESVSYALPGKIPQLVLLLAPQQWDEYVSKGLKGHVNDAYMFVLNTKKIPKEGSYKVNYFGNKLNLLNVVADLEENEVFTELKKI